MAACLGQSAERAIALLHQRKAWSTGTSYGSGGEVSRYEQKNSPTRVTQLETLLNQRGARTRAAAARWTVSARRGDALRTTARGAEWPRSSRLLRQSSGLSLKPMGGFTVATHVQADTTDQTLIGQAIADTKREVAESSKEPLLEAANEHGGEIREIGLPMGVTIEVAEDTMTMIRDLAINASIVSFVIFAAALRIFSVDHDWWRGWTLVEVIRNVPGHNWMAYEQSLEHNPVFAKMCISGTVYALGDYSAQCYEGRGPLGFDRARMVRSGLVGFCLHGSLSHYYYHFCEAIFPANKWWTVPAEVAFDQTAWSAVWNSTYYVTLGLLRLDSPVTIFSELKSSFFPLLTAGWKLWPFAHIITYGVVPLEQRVLWVDAVELVWVTILSMISNKKAEERKAEDLQETLVLQEAAQSAIAAVESEHLEYQDHYAGHHHSGDEGRKPATASSVVASATKET